MRTPPPPSSSSPHLDRIRTLEGFLQQDPDNLPLQRELVGLHLAAGQPRRAAAQAESALRLQPADTAMQATLVSCLLAAGDLQEALDRSAGWLGGEPGLVQIRQLQWAYAQAGAEAALADLLLQLFDANPWGRLAPRLVVLRGLHFLRRTAEARSRAEALLAQESSEALAGLAALLAFDEGDWARARSLVDAAWQGQGDNVDLLYLRASFALAAGEMASAEANARRALDLSPDDGRCWSVWGQVLLRAARFAEARPPLERALQLMPRHTGSHLLLGWTLLLQGDRVGARHRFTQALALDRNFADSHGALAVLDALEGRRDEARAALDRALRLDRQGLSARLATLLLERQPTDSPDQLHQAVLKEWERLQRAPGFAGLVSTPRTLH